MDEQQPFHVMLAVTRDKLFSITELFTAKNWDLEMKVIPEETVDLLYIYGFSDILFDKYRSRQASENSNTKTEIDYTHTPQHAQKNVEPMAFGMRDVGVDLHEPVNLTSAMAYSTSDSNIESRAPTQISTSDSNSRRPGTRHAEVGKVENLSDEIVTFDDNKEEVRNKIHMDELGLLHYDEDYKGEVLSDDQETVIIKREIIEDLDSPDTSVTDDEEDQFKTVLNRKHHGVKTKMGEMKSSKTSCNMKSGNNKRQQKHRKGSSSPTKKVKQENSTVSDVSDQEKDDEGIMADQKSETAHAMSSEDEWSMFSNAGQEKAAHCNVCNKVYATEKSLRRHCYKHHPEFMPKYDCKVCNKEYDTRPELWEHKRIENHGCANYMSKPRLCDLCGKRLKNTNSFNEHKLSCGAHIPNSFTCEHCGLQFKTKSTYYNHLRHVHIKNAMTCHICGRTYKNGRSLQLHKWRHNEANKKFACDRCDKSFFNAVLLKAHIRTHTKEKPYRCAFCDYCCAIKQNLPKHAAKIHKHLSEKAVKDYTVIMRPMNPASMDNLAEEPAVANSSYSFKKSGEVVSPTENVTQSDSHFNLEANMSSNKRQGYNVTQGLIDYSRHANVDSI